MTDSEIVRIAAALGFTFRATSFSLNGLPSFKVCYPPPRDGLPPGECVINSHRFEDDVRYLCLSWLLANNGLSGGLLMHILQAPCAVMAGPVEGFPAHLSFLFEQTGVDWRPQDFLPEDYY